MTRNDLTAQRFRSCDDRRAAFKSSLDQTTASCTIAKKQSPKYVYPNAGVLMPINEQLQSVDVGQKNEIIPKIASRIILHLNTRSGSHDSWGYPDQSILISQLKMVMNNLLTMLSNSTSSGELSYLLSYSSPLLLTTTSFIKNSHSMTPDMSYQ